MIRRLSRKGALKELEGIGVDREALSIFYKKADYLFLKVEEISIAFANIIKQASLSTGSDFAVHRDTITGRIDRTNGIWFGNRRQLEKLVKYLTEQPWGGLRRIGEELKHYLSSEDVKVSVRDRELTPPVIMGILNTTPDSFYDGGRYTTMKTVMERVHMIKDYIDILDIGGESTRPGAQPVDEEIEIKRTIPYIKAIKREFPDIILSIDTYKPGVAEMALDAGVSIVNDISGLRGGEDMIEVLKRYDATYVLNHIKGTPRDMQKNPVYDDVIREIYIFFKEKTELLLLRGVEKIIIDPGIGFGKRVEDNLEILARLDEFKDFGFPVLIGASRKSFMGKILNIPPEERLEPGIGVAVYSYMKGADIIRTHDPVETWRALKVIREIEYV